MFTNTRRGSSSCSARSQTRVVCTSTPMTALAVINAPSTTRKAAIVSPEKPASPGASIRLILRPCHSRWQSEDASDICRRCSSSSQSEVVVPCSTVPSRLTARAWKSIASTSDVLPVPRWPVTATLRIFPGSVGICGDSSSWAREISSDLTLDPSPGLGREVTITVRQTAAPDKPARPLLSAPLGRRLSVGPRLSSARDVVAGRGRLPGLPALVPGLGRRRGRRPARDHAAPRPPRLPRRGRALALADLSLAARGLRLRRIRLHGCRPAARDARRPRRARPRGARAPAEGAPRPGPLAHLDRAPVVPRASGAVRLVAGRRAAEQLGLGLRRPRLELRRAVRALVLALLLPGAGGPRLAQPGCRAGDAGRRPLLARPRRGRLPPRRDRPTGQGRAAARRPAGERALPVPTPPGSRPARDALLGQRAARPRGDARAARGRRRRSARR